MYERSAYGEVAIVAVQLSTHVRAGYSLQKQLGDFGLAIEICLSNSQILLSLKNVSVFHSIWVTLIKECSKRQTPEYDK